ncbi:MAG: TolC family protein [Bacteroidetes bacterium]|nr:TolC family protein [Bacteroidota bacterium]
MRNILVLVITINSLFAFGQTEINRLTLNDVIYIAQQQSPDALIAKHRFRRSYWKYRSYKASYLPAVSVSGTLPNINNSINEVTLPDGSESYVNQNITKYQLDMSVRQRIGLTGGQIFMTSGLKRNDNKSIAYNSTPINIGYSQPIFQYNSFKWEKQIEPLRYEEASRTYVENVEQINISASNHFFNLLTAQIQKGISIKNLSSYDTLYHIAQGRYQLGKIAENELLQLELNLLKAQAVEENAQLDYENMLFILKSYLRITDAEFIELIPPAETYHFSIDVAKAVEEAKNNTSTGLSFERRLLEAESEVNKAKMDGRFDVDIFAVYGLTQTASTIEDSYKSPLEQQQLSVGISIPILDWGQARGQIKMAESSAELTRTSIEQERVDFEQNIYLKIKQFDMQKNQLMIAAKSDTVAQKRYEVTQQRYLIGKVNDILELNLAQIDNDNAKYAYYQSLLNYWNNYYEIRKLTLFDFKEGKKIEINVDEIQ